MLTIRGGPTYFESEASPELEQQARTLLDEAEIRATVEYERREEVDGAACAVLVISLHLELEGSEALAREPEGMEVSIWMETEERLWFALEAGRPLRSEGIRKSMRKIVTKMSDGPEVEVTADLRGGFERSWSFVEAR